MTGEKRVVRVGVNIRVLLQAQLQGTALLPEAIGEGLAKRPAKRWQGIRWERCQCTRGADFGDQRHGGAPGCRASRPTLQNAIAQRADEDDEKLVVKIVRFSDMDPAALRNER